MMMAELWFPLVWRVLAGICLGLAYFMSLWWVARRLPRISKPALWIPLSPLARMLLFLGVVYFLMGHRWDWLVAIIAGFLLGRCLVFWQVGVLGSRRELS